MYLLKTLKIFWGISLITENDGKHFLGGLIFFFSMKTKFGQKYRPKEKYLYTVLSYYVFVSLKCIILIFFII